MPAYCRHPCCSRKAEGRPPKKMKTEENREKRRFKEKMQEYAAQPRDTNMEINAAFSHDDRRFAASKRRRAPRGGINARKVPKNSGAADTGRLTNLTQIRTNRPNSGLVSCRGYVIIPILQRRANGAGSPAAARFRNLFLLDFVETRGKNRRRACACSSYAGAPDVCFL